MINKQNCLICTTGYEYCLISNVLSDVIKSTQHSHHTNCLRDAMNCNCSLLIELQLKQNNLQYLNVNNAFIMCINK